MSASSSPAARCRDCAATWHSPLLVEGLRLIGSCPRCGTGEIEYRDAVAETPSVDAGAAVAVGVAPHKILGIPRL